MSKHVLTKGKNLWDLHQRGHATQVSVCGLGGMNGLFLCIRCNFFYFSVSNNPRYCSFLIQKRIFAGLVPFLSISIV